jgi:hypothetical protein
MRKLSVVSVVAVALLLTACNGNGQQSVTDTSDTDIIAEADDVSTETQQLVVNAETITAYGQILNNACVYLNENYNSKINGRVRQEYDKTCEKLHNINLKGINTFAQMSDEERNEVFAELEGIENSIFDSVAAQIGVKAELTEAITTTADKKADLKASGEVITSSPTETTTAAEVERITAAE